MDLFQLIAHAIRTRKLKHGGKEMNNVNQVKAMETRTRNNQVIFFKSQEDFAKALREGTGSLEEAVHIEELVEEK